MRVVRRPARVAPLVMAAVMLTIASCTSSDDEGRQEPRPSSAPVPIATTAEDGLRYEWAPVRMGAGGYVTGMAVHPDGATYVRTDVGGAYRWDRGAGTWMQLLTADGVPDPVASDYSVESLAVSPQDSDVVYLSAGGEFNPGAGEEPARSGRVLASQDGGRTWSASEQGFFISGNQEYRQLGERLAVDPADSQRVLLGTRREGLWASEDGGRTWTQVPTNQIPVTTVGSPGADQPGVLFVTFDPDDADVAYAGVGGIGVYRSSDGGTTWELIAAIDAPDLPAQGVVVDGVLYLGTRDSGGGSGATLRTYDGETWAEITPPDTAPAIGFAVDPARPGTIAAVPVFRSETRFWHTVDGGQSWSDAEVDWQSPEIPWLARSVDRSFAIVGGMGFDPLEPGALWWTNGIAVWQTVDPTADPVSFVARSVGIEELLVNDFLVPSGGNLVSAVADFQGFFHEDLGSFPEHTLVDDRFAGGTDIDASGQNPQHLAWVGAEYNLAPEYRSSRGAVSDDGGQTWRELENLVDAQIGGEIAMSATDPENLVWLPASFDDAFAWRDDPLGIFVTTDGGARWAHLADVGGTNDFHRMGWWLGRHGLAADRVEGGTFSLMTSDERLFVSTDGGLTWEQAANGPPCREDQDCHVFGDLVAGPVTAGELWAAVADGGLYRTSDRGATPWERVAGVDAAYALGFGAPLGDADELAIYLSGRVGGDPLDGIWRSSDGGASWELIARHPGGTYGVPTAVSGDPDRPGRVYVGYGGNGAVYGDDPAVG